MRPNTGATSSNFHPNSETDNVKLSLTKKVRPSALIWMGSAGLFSSTRYLTNEGGRPSLQALIPRMLLSSRNTTAQTHDPVGTKHVRRLTCTCRQVVCTVTKPQKREIYYFTVFVAQWQVATQGLLPSCWPISTF